jgi:uncharacterized protein
MAQKQSPAKRQDESAAQMKQAAASRAGAKRGKMDDMDEADDRPAEDKENTMARGRSGNFANDPKRAADAGRKGGQHSHQR